MDEATGLGAEESRAAARVAATVAMLVLLCSCGGGASLPSDAPPSQGEIALLFFGNSHTHANDVPGLVAALVRSARPGRVVSAVSAPGSRFLDERTGDGVSEPLLNSRRWSAVVLQAQRYSSSGNFLYPTDAAEDWVSRARAASAMPVLFPEWPRRGIFETNRIYALHLSIAQSVPACLPPIPQAFDIAQAGDPTLVLHAGDGNHSSPAGALLAALVIASTLTATSPTALATIDLAAVDADTQARLRDAAAAAIAQRPPRATCPERGV